MSYVPHNRALAHRLAFERTAGQAGEDKRLAAIAATLMIEDDQAGGPAIDSLRRARLTRMAELAVVALREAGELPEFKREAA